MTKSDVDIGHGLFLQFCKKAEVLYGRDFITPNKHLHLHLWDCVLDYGNPYSFWCFAFERYNYVMQHIHTNKQDPEIQLMKQVEKENHLFSLTASSAHPEQLLDMKYTFEIHICSLLQLPNWHTSVSSQLGNMCFPCKHVSAKTAEWILLKCTHRVPFEMARN